jgi:glycogen debranching enzyme
VRGAGWALNVLRPDLDELAVDRLEDACVYDDGALAAPYGVRSWPRDDPRFDARRYWRGPVWASITWLCALGFERHGRHAAAVVLRERFAAAVDAAGFREFVDGDTGEGLGATGFTWTAALHAFEQARRAARHTD